MAQRRGQCGGGRERRGGDHDESSGERTGGGALGRRRRRCGGRHLPRLLAAATAAVVAATRLGATAGAPTANATCGVAVDAGAWTTCGCERACGRQAVVCAYHTSGECNARDGEHYCVSYASREGSAGAGECRVECLAVASTAEASQGSGAHGREWVLRLPIGETSGAGAVVGLIQPPERVEALVFVGGKRQKNGGSDSAAAATTRVDFVAGLEHAQQLTSVAFIGLDLTSTGLPPLPTTLTHLELDGCTFAAFPVDVTTQLPALESLVLSGNRRARAIGGDEQEQSLPFIAEEELLALSSRLGGDQRIAMEEALTDPRCPSRRVATVGDFSLCVSSASNRLWSDYSITASARRLVDSSSSKSDGESSSASASASASGSQDASSIWPTSKYVFVALTAPLLYFFYKVGLFLYFLKTHPKYEREQNHDAISGMDTAVMTPQDAKQDLPEGGHDSDTQRPTLEGSSGSLSRSPAPISMAVADSGSSLRVGAAARPQQQQQLASANFWVDEELQSWRVDFRLFALTRCLTLSASQKRQTLRKASVTTALHPREIWLASYKADGADTTSPDRRQLVALKFVPPTTSSAAGGGAADANCSQDKLRAELRRQAQFSHPNVAAFVGVAWSPQTHLVAVTEYLEQGDLRQWLHRTSRPTEARDGQVFGPGVWSVAKLQMLVDLARALVYLHSMHPPVAHGNCNSRNVLLTAELRAKFSDFGNAAGEALSEHDRLAYSAVGSGRWISPEALLGRDTVATPKGSRDAGDVYSFGVLMAEIDSHALPFSDLMRANRSALPETDILQLIAQGALSPTLSDTCAPVIVELVAECTRYSPAQRPSSKQVLAKLQRALQEAKEAAARDKAARVGLPTGNDADPVLRDATTGDDGAQYQYYACDEGKAAPSFV